MGTERDEPLTPAGRMFVQPMMYQVINCALGLERPIEIDEVRTVLSDSLMIKHPRFSSLFVTDNHGREYWRKVELDIDRHIILHSDPVGEAGNDEAAINDYLAELAISSPLSTDKPLWEIHLLPPHKCMVVRVHHALGDGISLMSLMLTMCKKKDDPEQTPTIEPLVSSTMRSLWVKDKKTVVRGGEGVELWPRKLATAKFSLDDMKKVKSAVGNATINDVLFGIISSGLSRYLESRSPQSLQEGLRITGLALVNLRPSPGLQDMKELMKKNAVSGWGNKFGVMLLPIYYHRKSSDPFQYMKRAKMMIDRKKLSMEAFLSYQIGSFVMHYFGAKLASLLNYRLICNTSFTVSNVVGPREEFTIASIPVTYIRVTLSSLPHAITMHMVSYAGKAEMQILVAKDLVHDPENLAKCLEDALVEMKEATIHV